LQARISAAAEDLGQALGRSPRPRELAKTLGCSEDDVIEALTCDGAFAPSSLDAPTGPDGTATVGEALRTEDSEEQRADARLLLGPTVRALSARDRLIIELRFFHGRTQQEIGEEIGVTQMQVSRLLDRIFTDLRTAIGEHEAG
jgi:RNA polymerase sigma-B factor